MSGRGRLSPAHKRMLFEESCLSTSVAVERRYRTVASKAELAQLGFSKPQQRVPALVVPMYSPAGELVTHQIRPDTPRRSNKGKPIKYETPAGSPIRLDVHPDQSRRVKDASVPLWVTEGVKKADSLVSRVSASSRCRVCGAGKRTACRFRTGKTLGCGAAQCA